MKTRIIIVTTVVLLIVTITCFAMGRRPDSERGNDRKFIKGPSVRSNGVELKYKNTVKLTEAFGAPTISIKEGNTSFSLTGSESNLVDVEITYYEYAPEDAGFYFENEGIRYESISGKPVLISSIEGTIPNGIDLNIITGNGSITIESLNDSNEITLISGNGNISVAESRLSNLNMTTGNGSLKLNNSDIQKGAIKTGNGSIYIDNSRIAEIIAITGLGDIRVTNSQITNRSLETGLGKVIEK